LSDPAILVVTSIQDDVWRTIANAFCEELCTKLRDRHRLRLASAQPLTVEKALALSETKGPYIIVLVGEEDALPTALQQLSSLTTPIEPITVAFRSGTASLKLSNTSMADIIQLVRLAVGVAKFDDSRLEIFESNDNVISFRAEDVQPTAKTVEPALQDTATTHVRDDTPHLEYEAHLEDEECHFIPETIQTVLEWVETAAQSLSDVIFSNQEQPTGIYGRSSEDIFASITRLAGLRDAPFEKASECYLKIERMLAHDAAAKSPLVSVAKLLSNDPTAIKLLLIVLAPELDIRFQRLYGILNDDMGRRHATPGLAAAIIAAATENETPQNVRAVFASLERLRALRLIAGFGTAIASADEPLLIDAHVLDWLITGKADLLTGSTVLRPLLTNKLEKALQFIPASSKQFIKQSLDTGHALAITGVDSHWAETAGIILNGGKDIFLRPLIDSPLSEIPVLVAEAIRAAILLGKRLIVDLVDNQSWSEAFCAALQNLSKSESPQLVMVTGNPALLARWFPHVRFQIYTLPRISKAEKRDSLTRAMTQTGIVNASVLAEIISSKFEVPLSRLQDVQRFALHEADKHNISIESEMAWARALQSVNCIELPHLAQRLEPTPAPAGEKPLDRVVLPNRQRGQLEAIIQHVRMSGKVLQDWNFGIEFGSCGIATLFSGESGTGKTSAAHAIASTLNTDLYVIDLAKIVSKYIGETEKNLDIAFREAEQAGAVLLFDEADALFGKRSKVSDAHDRYANIEVAYLLQRIEKFNGLAILTTNHGTNLDPAFGRRLRFTVQFPFPEAAERLKIWERALPSGSLHRAESVDFTLAARRLEVTGGSIRQIMLHALMAAAGTHHGKVTPEHLQLAAREELGRLAKYDATKLLDTLFCAPQQAEAA
jgi:ATPase family associated with various cellular activities (AAA)